MNEYITKAEALKILDVSTQTLWRYQKNGKLQAFTTGYRNMYQRQQVEALAQPRVKS